MGQANEGCPIVLVRGVRGAPGQGVAADLLRPKELDLFRGPSVLTIPETILGRRSIRRYAQKAVSDRTIERILEIAAAAPSAHNRQPWRFAVLRDVNARKSLAQARLTAFGRIAVKTATRSSKSSRTPPGRSLASRTRQ
jgi:hypothetical protein